MLPPREGFSVDAVGAVGLLVHRLSDPGDLILGRPLDSPAFPDRRYRPVHPIGWRLRGDAARYAAGAARLLRTERPELIEVHNRPEVALALARHLPRIPLILVLHNDPQAMRRARSPRARRRLARRMRIVTVSGHLRHRFLEGIADESGAGVEVTVLPNCLDLATLPPRRATDARERLILFAGRLVADKGADSFVDACARALPRLPGWRAEMIGDDRFLPGAADTPFSAGLRIRAERAGIRLAGHAPHDVVLDAMSCAAIVVVPSRWQEPFGLTALEAMACGAALLAAPRGGLAELTRDAALPVDPDDPDRLADALVRLAGDPAERARLVAAGLARAAGYDLPQARARLAELRHDAVSAASPC